MHRNDKCRSGRHGVEIRNGGQNHIPGGLINEFIWRPKFQVCGTVPDIGHGLVPMSLSSPRIPTMLTNHTLRLSRTLGAYSQPGNPAGDGTHQGSTTSTVAICNKAAKVAASLGDHLFFKSQ